MGNRPGEHPKRRTVTIVGAGLAGMTAALHLLEAGFDVTVFETQDHVGGKFDAVRDSYGLPHEHAYHFLADWCLNFWDVAARVGLGPGDVVERDVIKFLTPGSAPLESRLTRLGHGASLLRFWDNVNEAPIPAADMIAYVASLLDLVVAGPDDEGLEFLNRVPVNGFMRSLEYMTDLAALLHQEALAKAFAIPSYETSVRAYRTFVRYFGRDTGGWILNGPVDKAFWKPFENTLESFRQRGRRYDLYLRHRVEEVLVVKDSGRPCVTRIRVAREGGMSTWWDVDNLILTIPSQALADLVEQSPGLRDLDQSEGLGLLDVRKLRSRQMASLDIYVRPALKGIPGEHVTMIQDPVQYEAGPNLGMVRTAGNGLGSKYGLSFVDNFQVWAGETKGRASTESWLNLVSADFDALAGLDSVTVKTELLQELSHYVPFDGQDIYHWHLRLNDQAPLFMNTVGSWAYRPETRLDPEYRLDCVWSHVPNLYVAGDYCRSHVDLVCLEGAVATAINVACALARQHEGEGVNPPKRPPEVSIDDCARLKVELEPWLEAMTRSRKPREPGRGGSKG